MPIRALHLEPIDAHVLDVVVVPIVEVAADEARLVDVETAVAAVEAEQGQQLKQVHVLVDDHLLPGGGVHVLHLARVLLIAAHEFEEQVAQRCIPVHAQRECLVRPGAVDVQRHLGLAVAGDRVEQYRPGCSRRAGSGHRRRRPDRAPG